MGFMVIESFGIKMNKPGRKTQSILNKDGTAQFWICEECGELNLTTALKAQNGDLYHRRRAACANCKTRYALILDVNKKDLK